MKIIQLATNCDAEGTENLYALGSDGSIWYLLDTVGDQWREIKPPPNAAKEKEKVQLK